MSREPVALRVRDAADLAQQEHMHRCNALCHALIHSILVPVLSVPQTIPHGTPKGNTAGSEMAARYSRTVDRLAEIELEARAYPLDWQRQERLEAERERLAERRDRLNADLAQIALPSRGTRAGMSGLYSVAVPALRYGGGIEGEIPETRLTPDTRTLPGELRARLDVFLLGGSEALPYWHCARRLRYYARHSTPDDIRALTGALLSNCCASAERTDLIKIAETSDLAS